MRKLDRYNVHLCSAVQDALSSIPDETPLVSLKLPRNMKKETKKKLKEIFEAIRPDIEKEIMTSFMLHII